MLGAAAAQGADIDLNMTAVEDPELLEAVERLNVDLRCALILARLQERRMSNLLIFSDVSTRSGARASAKLTSLNDEHQKLRSEASQLHNTNEVSLRCFYAIYYRLR